jgi:LacI family transcriptional regulator
MVDETMESIPIRPQLKDVARVARVSMSTASRALSGRGSASEKAVNAVRAASLELGYRPDPVARAMRAKSTGLVAIVVPGIGNPFFAELVEALEGALRVQGLEMILADSQGSVEQEAFRMETVIDRKADGLIVIPTDYRASAPALRMAQARVPVLQIDRQVDGFAGDYVGVDNATGIRQVLDHIVALGCRDAVFVSDSALSSTGRNRLDAFQVGIREVRGLSARPPLLGSYSIQFGREAMQRLLSEGDLPDAIVCGSDLIALGAVLELHQCGIAIPDDVKITGFDGILFSELCDPPLTTLRQPLEAMADEATRLLIARLDGDESPPQRSEIAPVLIINRSTKAEML